MKIAILASGSGSNAENIINYFKNNPSVEVKLIISNSKEAYVLERGRRLSVKSIYLNKEQLNSSDFLLELLKENEVDLIVLAGYLKLIPEFLINAFPQKIINIHPALLPKYGGKGMYGMNVHKAVVLNKEEETGITVHYVNSKYDEGQVIAQFKCELVPTDTAENVAEKIHELEMFNFPRVIEQLNK